MYSWDYNIYLGDDGADSHIDVATDENIMIIGEISSEDEEGRLKDILEQTKKRILAKETDNLEDFNWLLEDGVHPLGDELVSLAAALTIKDVLYLVTKGQGEIYAARGGVTQKLIEGNNTASGNIHEDDFFLLANKKFSGHVDQAQLQKLMFNAKPMEIVETLTPDLKGNNDEGMIALFMQAHVVEDDDEIVDESDAAMTEDVDDEDGDSDVPPESAEEATQFAVSRPPTQEYTEDKKADSVEQPDTQNQTQPSQQADQQLSTEKKSRFAGIKGFFGKVYGSGTPRGKKITFVFVLILIAVLGWSVISGNARRQREQFVKKVQAQTEQVNSNITEAKDLVGVNTQKSLQILDESRATLSELEKEAESMNLSDVDELASLQKIISDAESDIKKQEDGQYEVYYDLELISKDAGASALFSDGETLAMLDSDNRQVHLLDIDEKSVTSESVSAAADADFVALHQDRVYVFGPDIGVVRLVDGEEETIIAEDDDWGAVRDFWMYSGNVYILDTGSDEIYKYLVAEEGYSDKRSYIQSGKTDLGDATGIAIDASIYIANGGDIMKYTAGNPQTYSVSIPDDSDLDFEDIYTDSSLSSVYFIDKDSQRIFVADKDGEFEKQISASIIGEADDFIVADGIGILILADNTLYLISQ